MSIAVLFHCWITFISLQAMASLKENQNLHQDLTAKRKKVDSSNDSEEDEEKLKEKLVALRKVIFFLFHLQMIFPH